MNKTLAHFFLSLLLLAGFVFVPCSFGLDFTIPFLRAEPVLDGLLSEDVWGQLDWHSNFLIPGSEEAPAAATRFKVFHNTFELYIGVECDEPSMGNLVDTPSYSHGSSMIWMHDSIELNLLPEENLLYLYKFIINSKGISCALWGEDDNTDRANYVFSKSYANHLRAKVKRHADKWIVELALPFGAINFAPTSTSYWRFNIGRNRYAVKPTELSASSRLTKPKSHMQPRDFQKIELLSFSSAPYQWEFANLSTSLKRQASGALDCQFAVDIVNRSGEFRICDGRLALSDNKGAKFVSDRWEFDLTDTAFTRQQRSFNLPVQGEFQLDFDLYSSRGHLLKSLRKPVELRYQPMKVKVRKPAYRNNLYATMPDKSVELEITMEEFIGIPLTVTVEGEALHEKVEIAVSKLQNQARFDASNWPEGSYQITVSGQAGELPLREQLTLRKLPHQPGEIWLDEEGILHYDGKARLPVGWYLNSPDNPLYDTAVNCGHYKNLESFKKTVAGQEAKGRIAIYVPYQEFHPVNHNFWRWEIFRDPQDRRGKLTSAQKEKLQEFLPEAAKMSGIMGWYLADEPEGRDNNPAWFVELLELMQELDPYHPTFMLNYGIEGMSDFAKGCDILMPDCYPQYFEDGSTGKPRWSTSQWMQTVKSLGRPGWLMVQISPWPDFSPDRKLKGVPPSLDDIRSQFYQALLHDAKGITMYAHFDSSRFEVARLGSDAVAREIRVLESLLMHNSIPEAVTYQSVPEDRFFQVGMKKHQGLIGIIAVNTSLESRKVSFRLKEELAGGKLFVAGENRSLVVKGKEFSDVFGGGKTHVYLNDEALAARVESLQALHDSIQAAIAARKKPGNVIGTGELFAGDYRNFGKGIFPDNMPRLSASSERTTYSTKDSGTLYYLLDGMVDPPQAFYSWLPKKDEVSPWLHLVLPQEQEVSELRLYSGYDPKDRSFLLQAATALLPQEDGTFSALASSEQLQDGCLTLRFPKTKLKSLRIRIDRWQSQRDGYLLTEVELY